jgi:hypothetical protein
MSPDTSFVVLEKHAKKWIGGRTSNETFYGAEIVTGAGVGRKEKDYLLVSLLKKLNLHYTEFPVLFNYAKTIDNPVDIEFVIKKLRHEYKKYKNPPSMTFKEFAMKYLGNELYQNFIISAGYTDYENEDAYETLYYYGMEDNDANWTGLSIHWKQLIHKMVDKIGPHNIKTSNNVIKIEKITDKDGIDKHDIDKHCYYEVTTEKGIVYHSSKVIVATTITGIQTLVPGASNKNSLYQQIYGQPFLRLYAKFPKESAKIMQQYVPYQTIVPGPLHKILPIDQHSGIYMIAYTDNKGALFLKEHLKNTPENRVLYCDLLEQSLGIPKGSLKITALLDFYWPIGTHYYGPLHKFKTRKEFIDAAQHPEPGMLVVGEVVSRQQGWTEGALESVHAVLNKKWIENTKC